jgi:Tfp pilus assembly protein PilF
MKTKNRIIFLWLAILVTMFVLVGCSTTETVTVIEQKSLEPCEVATNHIQQGMAYAGQQDYDNSEKEYMTAIELCPSSVEAHSNLGVTYAQMGDFNKAERSVKKAVELNPTDATAKYNLAAVYSLQGKLDLSLEALDDALSFGFNNIEALRNDTDLDNVRRDQDYIKTLEKHRVFLR